MGERVAAAVMLAIAVWASIVVVLSFAMEFALLRLGPRITREP